MSEESNANWAALRDEIAGVVEAEHVPGAALGVVLGEDTFTAGFGVTNVNHPLDVTDETYFQVGSISKTFVATAVMKLVEAGKVELDAKVRTYLPEFGVADEAVSASTTVKHLLTHMGGWEGDWFRRTGSGDDALEKYMGLMKQIE
ncbi:MAG: serine hydrolase domain-containing protein, partial [Planctomycetota bacterium]